MRDSTARSTSIAALLFALLYAASLFGVMDLPEGSYSDAEIRDVYADSGKRTALILGAYMLAGAGVAFLWFLASLRDAVRSSAGEGSPLPMLVFAGGLIYCAMLFCAGAVFGAIPLAVTVGELEAAAVDPGLVRTLVNVGFVLLLVYGLVAAAAMIVGAAFASRTDGPLPRWLMWIGFPTAALLLLGPLYMPQLMVPVWVVAASVAVGRARRSGRTTRTAASNDAHAVPT